MKKQKKELASGVILVAIGLIALLSQIVTIPLPENMGLLIVPGLGGLFLLWGIFTRNDGLMIPGGILSGVGWGIYAIAGPLSNWQGDDAGGVFLISLGLGFALITVVTAVFAEETHWWALIPGGIISFIGTALLFGGALLTLASLLGKLWPLALILLGIAILFNARKGKSDEENFITEK